MHIGKRKDKMEELNNAKTNTIWIDRKYKIVETKEETGKEQSRTIFLFPFYFGTA